MSKVYAVGVGPGAPEYVTEIVRDIILGCDVVVGYAYTLKTIRHLLDGKQVYDITMKNQEETYRKIRDQLGDGSLVVPFTGDVSFSESEVVDRLIEMFGKIEIVPGVSSFQVAAARAQVPIDKSRVITMHVTSPIEERKDEMKKAILDGYSVILIPRPWPRQPDKHFMPSEIAVWLKQAGFDTKNIKVHVFENLTTEDETVFEGVVEELEGKDFSDLSVMVINQARLDSYMNYKWQWQGDADSRSE